MPNLTTKAFTVTIWVLALFLLQVSIVCRADEPPVQGIGIELTPTAIYSTAGRTIAVNVKIVRTNNTSPLTLAVTELPQNFKVSFSVNPIQSADEISVANIQIPARGLGKYRMLFTASDGVTSVENEFILIVTN